MNTDRIENFKTNLIKNVNELCSGLDYIYIVETLDTVLEDSLMPLTQRSDMDEHIYTPEKVSELVWAMNTLKAKLYNIYSWAESLKKAQEEESMTEKQ